MFLLKFLRAEHSVPAFRNCVGTALLELSIVISTLLLLVSGLVTYAWVFQQLGVVFDSVRHAARAGGALAFDYRDYCTHPAYSADCANVTSNPGTLPEASVNIACQYIVDSGFTPSEFRVRAEVRTGIQESATFSGALVLLSVVKQNNPLGFEDLFGRAAVSTDLAFLLETECTG